MASALPPRRAAYPRHATHARRLARRAGQALTGSFRLPRRRQIAPPAVGSSARGRGALLHSRPDPPSTPSGRPLGKSLGKSLPSAERTATLKTLGLRALCEADAGTRTPDPFITSERSLPDFYLQTSPFLSHTACGYCVGTAKLSWWP